MTIQHSAITDPNIHEPKGVASASVDFIYVANGAGSGTWQKITPKQLKGLSGNGAAGQVVTVDGSGNFVLVGAPHGLVHFYNASTPYTLTYPTSFTKLAPTTTASGTAFDMTEATTARLTYTGTDTVPLTIQYSISLDQASGSSRDITLAIYKNGVATNGYSVVTTDSGAKHNMSGMITVNAATNDYFEVYALNSGVSGDIRVYAFQLNAIFAGS